MDLASAKMIGAGLASIALIGAGVGIGIIFGNYLAGALRNPGARGETTASARNLGDGTLRGLPPGNNADSRLDADRSAERGHLVRYILEHVVSRILPPSRLSAFRFP